MDATNGLASIRRPEPGGPGLRLEDLRIGPMERTMSLVHWMSMIGRGAAVGMLSLCVPAVAMAQQPATAARQSTPGGALLELSMEQAVTMALETNLGLKADRLDVSIASENVVAARAAFKPLLRSSFTRNTADR